jgi:hypothetical protein
MWIDKSGREQSHRPRGLSEAAEPEVFVDC